jgi:GT2 family glycosyltransferase
MKIGLIIYHKNIFNYVNAQIIANCLNSIKNQTFDSFDILELDYSNVNQIPIRLVDEKRM